MSARAKLLLAFLTVSTILGGASGVAILKMRSVNAMLNKLYERDLVGLSACKEANVSLIRIGRALGNVVLATDEAEMQGHRSRIGDYAKTLGENLAIVRDTTKDDEVKRLADEVEAGFAEFQSQANDAIQHSLASQQSEALEALQEGRATADALDNSMSALCSRKEALAKDSYVESDCAYASALWLVSTCVLGGVALSLAMGWLISRWLTKALLEVERIAQSLAGAAQQLSAASEELSSGAQEQASSLEETAASLEEITSTVQQNADNAQQANQLTAGAREVAEKGGAVTQQAVAGMSEINAASTKIADIITTIDEIAFQTNLLALNAAVEAARAGEQGRGFAVVAGEVRNLAQRSAGAAKEIKALIQDSVAKVGAGADLVNQSGSTLEEIVTSVKRVTDIVAEIAAASREQASGIEQVNRAVTQMDQVTQVNASQTEELSGTAESLAGQARHLQEVVAQFNLTKTSSVPVAAPRKKQTVAAGSARRQAPVRPAASDDFDLEGQVERELQTVGANDPFGSFEEF
ncbi:MAG: histidine kinase [Planctomycetaceae bacterium]|nr:histidine kinase [Planctomycetaceae bacterium]